MKFDLWQVPVLVMTGIIVLESLISLVLRRWRNETAKQHARTLVLGLLAGLVGLIGVVALLGPDLADQLAGVAGTFLSCVALWLAIRSHWSAEPDGVDARKPDLEQQRVRKSADR